MKLRLIALPFLAALLVSCASYQQPNSANAATVSGSSTRNGFFDWSTTSVYTIDNQLVLSAWSVESKIRVSPGMHRFMVFTQFDRNFFDGGPYEARTDVTATLRPNQHYRFVSKVDGSKVKVWAVNNQGQPLTSVVSSSYMATPRPIVIPIIVPAR